MDSKNIVRDGDLLNAVEMFLDYGSSVYGFNGHYYNMNRYQVNEDLVNISDEIDAKQGKLWMGNSLNEDRLSDEQTKWLKNAIWLYNY